MEKSRTEVRYALVYDGERDKTCKHEGTKENDQASIMEYDFSPPGAVS